MQDMGISTGSAVHGKPVLSSGSVPGESAEAKNRLIRTLVIINIYSHQKHKKSSNHASDINIYYISIRVNDLVYL